MVASGAVRLQRVIELTDNDGSLIHARCVTERRLESRLAQIERRLDRRIDGLQARVDTLRSDLIKVALAVPGQDEEQAQPEGPEGRHEPPGIDPGPSNE